MNILGIYGAIGWDGNIPYIVERMGNFWVHGSGATLIMNGKLKNAINEERFSRIKYDGTYPKLSIQHILDYNKLTNSDIDLVVYVCSSTEINFALKQSTYIEKKLQEYFPNCKVEFLAHHLAHSAATFYTSGFKEANILSFDGAGDYEHPSEDSGKWLTPHFKFSIGQDTLSQDNKICEVHTEFCGNAPMHNSFGNLYDICSLKTYNIKTKNVKDDHYVEQSEQHSYPGKIMGLAAFGDYQKVNLPEWFSLEKWENEFPQLQSNNADYSIMFARFNPDDLAAWMQHQFEKYLLLFLSNIPKKLKRDNLCLGGGCALNILANSKIIEQGIYKNVHVNTAPNDDGLHFGAALFMAAEYEKKITLPDDIGYLGITYTDEDIEEALCVL